MLPIFPDTNSKEQTIDKLVDSATVKEVKISTKAESENIATQFQQLKKTDVVEVVKIMRMFKNDKEPGPDGIMI